MLFLESAIKIFLMIVFLFFLVFGYQCLIWTNRDRKEAKNILSGAIVSLFYNFKILLLGFLIILIISLCLHF